MRYGSVYLRLAMNGSFNIVPGPALRALIICNPFGKLSNSIFFSAFGIGNMIYCCLEVAHGLVKYQNQPCGQAELHIKILLPACRAVLTLAQMHFMLFNNKVRKENIKVMKRHYSNHFRKFEVVN